MRKGEVGSRYSDNIFSVTYEVAVARSGSAGGESLTIQAHLGTGIKAQSRRFERQPKLVAGSKVPLRYGGIGNAADNAQCGIRVGDEDLGYLCRLKGVECIRASNSRIAGPEINDVDLATTGHNDEGLVGDGINGEAAKKGQRVGRAICDGQRGCACSRQSSLGVEVGLAVCILRVNDAGVKRCIASKALESAFG